MALDGATLVSGIVSAHLMLVLTHSNLSEDLDMLCPPGSTSTYPWYSDVPEVAQ
jgi:hypothetical protein